MSGPAVIFRGVRRAFGSRVVLDGIDLDVQPGEFVALLGRSGSGKSTFLRGLAGLDPEIEGSLKVPTRRSVVFQEPRLLPWRRILENVTTRPEGPRRQGAGPGGAGRGRPARPPPGLARDAVRRRGPAGRAGPGAGA